MGVEVRAEKVVKVYRTGKLEVVALRGLDMHVKPGEVVSVMGPSGCGKTTLLNLIGGLDRPTAGSIYVDGWDVAKASEKELERYRLLKVGFVFQFFNLIPTLTALENVELPMAMAGVSGSRRRKRALELLEMVGLSGRVNHRPDELSGGEQQRVAIACALANDPPLILADEPTGEVDRESAKGIVKLLVGLGRDYGKTVIIATHNPEVARSTDRILRIEDGVIVGEYIPAEFVEAVPAVEERYVKELETRMRSLREEAKRLEEEFRSGRMSAEEFASRYMEVKKMLELLEAEARKHGM